MTERRRLKRKKLHSDKREALIEKVVEEPPARRKVQPPQREVKPRRSKKERAVETEQIVLRATSLGIAPAQVAALAKVRPETIRHWMKRDPEFRKKMEAARAQQVANLLSKALQLCDSKSENIRLHAVWRYLGILDPSFRPNAKVESEDIAVNGDESYL